jgi:hypothetical protein
LSSSFHVSTEFLLFLSLVRPASVLVLDLLRGWVFVLGRGAPRVTLLLIGDYELFLEPPSIFSGLGIGAYGGSIF